MSNIYYHNDRKEKGAACKDCIHADRSALCPECVHCFNYKMFVHKNSAEGYLMMRQMYQPKPSLPVITPDAIKDVIFNDPATIVFWQDGTKTVVKCQDGEAFDPEKGLTMAITKKIFGNKGNYCNVIKKWTDPWYKNEAHAIQNSLSDFLAFMQANGKRKIIEIDIEGGEN